MSHVFVITFHHSKRCCCPHSASWLVDSCRCELLRRQLVRCPNVWLRCRIITVCILMLPYKPLVLLRLCACSHGQTYTSATRIVPLSPYSFKFLHESQDESYHLSKISVSVSQTVQRCLTRLQLPHNGGAEAPKIRSPCTCKCRYVKFTSSW